MTCCSLVTCNTRYQRSPGEKPVPADCWPGSPASGTLPIFLRAVAKLHATHATNVRHARSLSRQVVGREVRPRVLFLSSGVLLPNYMPHTLPTFAGREACPGRWLAGKSGLGHSPLSLVDLYVENPN